MNVRKILNPVFKYVSPKIKFWIKNFLYKFALKLNPNSGFSYFKLFNIHYQMRNTIKLFPPWDFYLKEAIKVDPDFFFLHRREVFNTFLRDSDLQLMEHYMQIFEDFQSVYLKEHNLDHFEFRFSSPFLFSSYNVNAYLDTFLKAMELGLKPKHQIIILLPENEKIINPYMLELWQKYVKVIRDKKTIEHFSTLRKYFQYDIDFSCSLNGKGMFIEHAKVIVQKEWEKRNYDSLLRLSSEDKEIGWKLLGSQRIIATADHYNRSSQLTGRERDYKRLQKITREGGWFVTLHVRDSGYLLGKYDKKDDPNLYRNADIDSYTDAIQSIVERGGYVVRVGDPKMKPMPEEIKGVFDYAHSGIRSNKMDIFLFSQCRFFIATNSGPWLIPCLFNVPTVVTNLLPLIRPWTKDSLFIPKILKLNNENRILTIKEMLSPEFGKFYTTRQYLEKNISIIDNTKEELNTLVLEMLDYLDGSLVYSDEDNEEQNKLSNLYLKYSKYGDSGRMGRDFLKRHFSEQLSI